MENESRDYTLEFLLDFDGHVHWLEGGYWIKFKIRQVEKSSERPHGLCYSFTLHDPAGRWLIGFDNAHPVHGRKAPNRSAQAPADHWHRSESDKGRPYQFQDSATLIEDFFTEVERVLKERDVSFNVVAVEDTDHDAAKNSEPGRPSRRNEGSGAR